MMTGNELRAALPRLLRGQRAHGGALLPAGPRPGPDPALHQRGHGAVQGGVPRRGARATTCGRPPPRSACGPAASTTTWRTSAAPPATTPSSRCWATSPSATTSRSEAIGYAGSSLPRTSASPRTGSRPPSSPTTTRPSTSGGRWPGLGADRILRLGEKDNFWAMGDTGPCGPCSEAHFHQGDHLPCAEEAAGRPLPGAGLRLRPLARDLEPGLHAVQPRRERRHDAAAQALDRHRHGARAASPRCSRASTSSFDTDLLRPLISHVERLLGKAYGRAEDDDVSMRVIADHARAATFLITDGVTPSNEWRGYVLRRIMRRAMRHGRMLGLEAPFLWDVTGTRGGRDGRRLPGDPRAARRGWRRRCASRRSASRRRSTSGMAKIREYIECARRRRRHRAGRRPLPVHALRHPRVPARPGAGGVRGRRLAGDRRDPAASSRPRWRRSASGRGRARRSAGGAGDGAEARPVYQQLSAALPRPEFLGYAALAAPARILALVADGRRGREARAGRDGGGDPRPHARLRGVRRPASATPARSSAAPARAEIADTYYRGSQLIVHRVQVTEGRLREGEEVAVDAWTRAGARACGMHHTGTHLLHAALRRCSAPT